MLWISRSAALYRQLFQRRKAQRELDAEVGPTMKSSLTATSSKACRGKRHSGRRE
jgi:hypothetical protein